MITKPSAITEEVLRNLKDSFLIGCTKREACGAAGIAESTLYKYISEHDDYKEQVRIWRENPVRLARKTVYEEMAGDGKLAMDYLKHKKSGEFNTKQVIDQKVTEANDYSNLDKEELEKRIAEIEASAEEEATTSSGSEEL